MRKIGLVKIALVLAGAFLLAAVPARAQFTTVTATVVDSNGIPYANGTMSAILVPGSSTGYRLSGQPYSGRIGPVTLDSTGTFSANFGDVTRITPGSSQWLITVNSNQGGIPAPLGTGAQTFTYTSTGTIVSGSSPVNISTQLNALAPKLTNITVGSGSVTSVGATSPIVATPSPITTTGTISCPTCVTATGGGLISCSVTGGVAYENGTANDLTCDTNHTWNSINQYLNIVGSLGAVATVAQVNAENGVAVEGIVTGADTGANPYDAVGGFVTPTLTGTATKGIVGVQGLAFPGGTGSYPVGQFVSGVEGNTGNDSSGTIGSAAAFSDGLPSNIGGGSITNLYGYYAFDEGGIGTTINAAYYAAAQTAGANNWGYFDVSVNQDHFGSLFSGTDNTTAGTLTLSNAAAAAHTIFGSAATTTNTIKGFATVPTTNHLVSCVVTTTTCVLTDSGSTTGSFANTSLSNLSAVAINAALLPGTTNSIALGSSSFYWSNAFLTAEQCGIAGTTSCAITGAGSTSGTATLTWPAIAGTVTNNIVSSNGMTFNAGIQIGVAGTRSGVITMEGSTSGAATITAPAIAGTTTNQFVFSNGISTVNLTASGAVTFSGLTNADTGDYVCYNATVIEFDATACVASLRKYKQNIHPLTGALAEAMALQPVEYRWKPDYRDDHLTHVGFIAEDVEQVDKRIAAYTDAGVLESVDYQHITAIDTAAIQEMQQEIEMLKSQVQSLQSMLKGSAYTQQIAGAVPLN